MRVAAKYKAAACVLACLAAPAFGQSTHLSTYGTPGLIDLPTAEVLNDGEVALTFSAFGPVTKSTVTFQLLPRVYGSFRYGTILDFDGSRSRYDRSFDIHFQIADETRKRPALAVGLRDFGGTGIYSSEYIVATKTVAPGITVTGGLGWGRLAGRNSFSNPLGVIADRFKNRPGVGTGGIATTGQLDVGAWFRGDVSPFAGVKWQVNDRLTLLAEYSPDRYTREAQNTPLENKSGINLGLSYRFNNGVNLNAYTVGGTEVGLQLSFVFDPAQRRVPGGYELAPQPLVPRATLANASLRREGLNAVLETRMEDEGIRLQSVLIEGDQATVRVQNLQWDVEAQALGRINRILANTLPPNVETFKVVFQQSGMPITAVTTQRSDLEALEFDFDGAWRTLARARIDEPGGITRAGELPQAFPSFDWRVGPYTAFSFFDPDSPVRADLGVQLSAAWRPLPGLTLAGVLRHPIVGNVDTATRRSNSVLPRVRTDSVLYAQESDLEINVLTAEYLWRPQADVFARVTAGYLENMFGGLSAELLWYPVGSKLALGAELNYVKQRDYDIQFGFRDYSVVTGHASAYYKFDNGYRAQVDVGRYLAGDWGATFGLDREFNNGFKIGAYFTLTDVPFDDFGEGSFDKGIRFEMPVSWFTGKPTRAVVSQTIQPVLRDGGARLNVPNRLFGVVKDYRGNSISDGWGRYLR